MILGVTSAWKATARSSEALLVFPSDGLQMLQDL